MSRTKEDEIFLFEWSTTNLSEHCLEELSPSPSCDTFTSDSEEEELNKKIDRTLTRGSENIDNFQKGLKLPGRTQRGISQTRWLREDL